MVQEKLAELFQEWALLFQSDAQLSYFTDTYNRLKREMRILFPRPSSSLNQIDPTTIVSTTAPPDWIDSSVCLRCRDPFTFSNRKHHCRKCGGCFCAQCSANQMPILAMGISEQVRVCDRCFEAAGSAKKVRVEQIPAPEPVKPAEDEDLKRAIEASLQDQLKQVLHPADQPIETITSIVQPTQTIPTAPQTVHMIQPLQPVQTTKPVQSFNVTQSHPEPGSRDLVLSIELETVQLFNQLVTRLTTTTTPKKTNNDHSALLHLSNEMRSLQRRLQLLPQYATLSTELSISLGRLELLLAPQTRPQSSGASSNGSSELERMRGSFLGGLKSPNEPLRNQLRSLTIEGPAFGVMNEDLLKRPSQPDQFFASGLPVTPLGPIETTAPIVIPARTIVNENAEIEKKSKKRKKEKKHKEEKHKKDKKKKKEVEEKEKHKEKETTEKQKKKDKRKKAEKRKEKTKEEQKETDKQKKSVENESEELKIDKAKEHKKKTTKRKKSKIEERSQSEDEKAPLDAKHQIKKHSKKPEKQSEGPDESAIRRRSDRNKKETINLIDL